MKLMSGGLSTYDLYNIWFQEKQPTDVSAALEAADAFYSCGEEPGKGASESPAYSFKEDSGTIIAAFQREYGIDLTTVQMHWWRFSALLSGLMAHSFSERVQYRVCDTSKIKTKDMRSQYASLKRKYALARNGEAEAEPQTVEEYERLLLERARGKER